MENQHRKIKGYRELTQEEIDLINRIKEKGKEVGELIKEIQLYHYATGGHAVDMDWVRTAQVDLQKAFMSLTRSVTCPDFF